MTRGHGKIQENRKTFYFLEGAQDISRKTSHFLIKKKSKIKSKRKIEQKRNRKEIKRDQCLGIITDGRASTRTRTGQRNLGGSVSPR